MREQLATAPARLVVSTASTGTLTVRHRTLTGWEAVPIALSISDGELVARTDASGALSMDRFAVGFAPFDLPGTSAQLSGVRIVETAPVLTATAWTDDDHASGTASSAPELMWSLAVGDAAYPLGTLHLPAMPVAIAVAGDGVHVDGTLALHATGVFWSWADVLELADLDLALDATLD